MLQDGPGSGGTENDGHHAARAAAARAGEEVCEKSSRAAVTTRRSGIAILEAATRTGPCPFLAVRRANAAWYSKTLDSQPECSKSRNASVSKVWLTDIGFSNKRPA